MKQLIKKTISLGLSVLLMLGFLPPTEAKAVSNQDDRRIIVAMGDSYSSGEGIEPFFCQDEPLALKVTEADWLAHRSQKAWSGMLELPDSNGNIIKMSDHHWDGINGDTACWYFVAASGAETWNIDGGEDIRGNNPKPDDIKSMSADDIDGYKKKHEAGIQEKTYHQNLTLVTPLKGVAELPKQRSVFDHLGGEKADYVTITIGGNDAGFQDIMMEAATGLTYIDPMHLANRIEESVNYITGVNYTYHNSNNKRQAENYNEEIWWLYRTIYDGIQNRINKRNEDDVGVTTDGLLIKLKKVYDSIEQSAGKQATIIVAGYPHLVVSDVSKLDPQKTLENKLMFWEGGYLDSNERKLLNQAVDFFNDMIELLVNYCREKEGMNIWFVRVDGEDAFLHHEPGTREPYINGIMILQREDLDNSAFPPLSAYSFHPNEEGAKAYARCVQAKIDELEGIERDPTSGEVISVNPPTESPAIPMREPVEQKATMPLRTKATYYERAKNEEFEIISYTIYSYDPDGHLKTEDVFSPPSTNPDRTIYSYNEKGLLVSKDYDPFDYAHTLYEYDNHDRLIKSGSYGLCDGGLLAGKEYFYDDEGHLIRTHEMGGDISEGETRYYYSEGNCIREEFLGENYRLLGYVEYTFTKGNLLDKETFFSEDGIAEEACKYLYYPDDKLKEIQRTSFSEHIHIEDAYTAYEYDESGNLIKESIFSPDGILNRYIVYEYGSPSLFASPLQTALSESAYIPILERIIGNWQYKCKRQTE